MKQVRVSLLVVLVLSAFDLADALVHTVWAGGYLATLGDWGLTTLALCVLVTVVHSAIYGGVRLGRRVRERRAGPGRSGTTGTAGVE